MNASSSPDGGGARLKRAYDGLLDSGALKADAAQAEAVALLGDIADAVTRGADRTNGLFGFFKKPKPVTGAYIWGEVGRGKTLLMDLFFDSVPVTGKRRVHFHEFMDEVHEHVTAFRAKQRAKGANADPIPTVANKVAGDIRLLCFDEFHVNDITNAMLLQRLFEQLFAKGITVVATSNVKPERLYEDGLNRQLFLPFIDLLERHVTVLELAANADYRRAKFAGEKIYAFGNDTEADAVMDHMWDVLSGGQEGESGTIRSLGRDIVVPHQAMGAARFGFADLCEKPLGARDYLKIAHAFHSLVIDHVPQFDRAQSSAAKRFILLIDTLYDRGVKLAASFAVPLEELGADEKTAFEFQRCVSRLMEMQSDDYLAAARTPERAAAE